jgi:hypothetical protein
MPRTASAAKPRPPARARREPIANIERSVAAKVCPDCTQECWVVMQPDTPKAIPAISIVQNQPLSVLDRKWAGQKIDRIKDCRLVRHRKKGLRVLLSQGAQKEPISPDGLV